MDDLNRAYLAWSKKKEQIHGFFETFCLAKGDISLDRLWKQKGNKR